MPKYGWKIENLLFEEDVRAMYNLAAREKEAVLIALLWITGARPAELAELKKENVQYDSSRVNITLATKKLGEGGDFKIRNRTLSFVRPTGLDTNIYIETVVKYVAALPPEALLLPHTTRWQENTINRIGQKGIGQKVSPYHFRHSCLTWMASNGATIDELMQFKGALSVLSISMYMKAKPFVVSLQNQRRTRGAVALPIPAKPTEGDQPPESKGGNDNANGQGDTGETKPSDGEGSATP
ncbi:MAG: site-specific integrase [Candidatus Omnitrophica bacterium]|nr:site-specific integrase [Candidatus Omnitrophota bacterium]